jgi:hypothetical protein
MRFLLAILLLGGYGFVAKAQDLTGQWTGGATDNSSGKKQKLVLTISEKDSSFGGVLHWYFPERQYIRHLIVRGRYYGRDSILTVREDSAIQGKAITGADSLAETLSPGAGFFILYYTRAAHKEVLEGRWSLPGGGRMQKDNSVTIRLEKKSSPFIPIVLPSRRKKDSAQSKALLGRESPIAATIPVLGTDSVKVELYDNGEIDGDSVSLYFNGELVLQHLRLTAEPKTLMIPIDKSLSQNKLVLFAENLGKLPPNTALMEVTIKGKTYHLFLSTDYHRNAMIEFDLQE